MKRTIAGFCAMLCLCGVTYSQSVSIDKFSTTVLTNTATVQISNTVTSGATYSGHLDYFYVDLSGYNSPTVTVALAAVSTQGYPSRTLFAKSVSADGGFPVRQLVVGPTGTAATDAWAPVPLFEEKLVMTAYSSGTTNSTGIAGYPYITP